MTCLLSALLLSSCCSRNCEEALLGKVEEGRYYDPQGFFSIDLPQGEVSRIQESGSLEDYSGVIFCQGEALNRVEAVKIPDQDFMYIALEMGKDQRKEMLKMIFQEKIFPLISKEDLKADILCEKLICLDEESGYFVLLSLKKEDFEIQEAFLSCFIGDQYVIFSHREKLGEDAHIQALLHLHNSFKNESLEKTAAS